MLIVIEGTDGSGKTLQSRMLVDALLRGAGKRHLSGDEDSVGALEGAKKTGAPRQVEYIEFPDYASEYGRLIAAFLRGDFGPLQDIPPKLMGFLYAADRLLARERIRDWLDKGAIVVANRYAESNIAHQGARVADVQGRRRLQDWLYSIDYDLFGLPRPDLVLLLDLPVEVSQQLIQKKAERSYLQGNADVQEKDVSYQQAVRVAYHEAAQRHGWWIISCSEDGVLSTPERIHQQVLDACLRRLAIE